MVNITNIKKIRPKEKYEKLYEKSKPPLNSILRYLIPKEEITQEDIEEMRNVSMKLTKFSLIDGLIVFADRLSEFSKKNNYKVGIEELYKLKENIESVLSDIYIGSTVVIKDPKQIKKVYKYLLDSVKEYDNNLENIKRVLINRYEMGDRSV